MNVEIKTKDNLIRILDWLYDNYETTSNDGRYRERLTQYTSLMNNCPRDNNLGILEDFSNCKSGKYKELKTITEEEFIAKYIDKQLTAEDLVEGEVYYAIGGDKSDNDYVFKNYNKGGYYEYICIQKRTSLYYKDDLTKSFDWGGWKLRLATPEEKHWLKACIKANEFIDKETALKDFNMNDQDKYWRVALVDGCQGIDGSKKGDIFKSKSNGQWSKLNKNDYHYVLSDNLQSKPFTSLKEAQAFSDSMKEFVLPEYYKIRVTKESKKALGEWRTGGELSINTNDGYCCNGPNTTIGYHCAIEQDGHKKYTEITFNQFKEYVLKEEVKDDSKFKVGRWYKNIGSDNSYIVRFNGIDDTGCFCTNTGYIDNGKYRLDTLEGRITNHFSEAIECSLEEIQQYLPFSHSNKISTKSIEKWSVGSYVVFLEDNVGFNKYKKGEYQEISEFKKNRFDNGGIRYKNGTENDIKWENIGKIKWFATKQEAEGFATTLINKSKYEYPKYVECIKGYSNQFTKGKVYKVKKLEGKDITLELDDAGSQKNGFSDYLIYFKPSTKEAYDAQLEDFIMQTSIDEQNGICKLCTENHSDEFIFQHGHSLCEGCRCDEAEEEYYEYKQKEHFNESDSDLIEINIFNFVNQTQPIINKELNVHKVVPFQMINKKSVKKTIEFAKINLI